MGVGSGGSGRGSRGDRTGGKGLSSIDALKALKARLTDWNVVQFQKSLATFAVSVTTLLATMVAYVILV